MKNILWTIIPAVIFGGEYALKNHVETKEPEKKTRKILGGGILVRKYHNFGAAFSPEGKTGRKANRLITVLSLLLTAVVTVVFALTLTTQGNSLLKAGLSVLLGGAFSNTYDRLKRKYVVDYFSFNVKWEPLRRIVFNLSDFCILIGALLVALKA